jgi:dTDP-4-dehydrorhamnose 3,5-epimerase
VRGSIWDVAVDVRVGSPTYSEWVAQELTSNNGLQLFVPVGFAHGFITLEPDTEVQYKTSDFYAPGCEDGVIWNDPELNLPWPIAGDGPILSEKDTRLGALAELKSPFEYAGYPLTALEP